MTIRSPTLSDAREIWRLVNESGVLDPNSAYLYLLLCRDFSDTCLVAEQDSGIVGFVTSYRPPANPQVLFVWQIGVCRSARRRGLGRKLLTQLIARCDGTAVRFLETTVSPSNDASRHLFESFAEDIGATLTEVEDGGFAETDFPLGDHESEPRLRIGPLFHHDTTPAIHTAGTTSGRN